MPSEDRLPMDENRAEPMSANKWRWRQVIRSAYMPAILLLFGLLQYPLVSSAVSIYPRDDFIAVTSAFVFYSSIGGLIGWAIGYGVSGKPMGSVIGAILGMIALHCLLL